jgi:LPXTG-motif cell wall-anchored protein
MDDQRFDALTRAFAKGSSRRTAIKGLFGGVIGGVAVASRLDLAGAQTPCGECPGNRPICCGDIEGGTCTTVCCSDADCGGDFCLFIGNDPHNSVCVQCVADDDCGQPDVCTAPACIDNVCNQISDCPAGTTCCDVDGVGIDCVDLSGGGMYCGACGVVCSACEVCLDGACVSTCIQPDACTVVDCVGGVCEIVEGGCPPGETCCDVDGVGIDCVNLNAPDDQYCGACGVVCDTCETCVNGVCTDACPDCSYCSQGTCFGECSQSQECCNDECVPLGQCVHICIPEAQPCEDRTLECCPGLQCCIAGESSYCAECCADSDCGDCEICDSGVCAPVTDCCRDFGDYCGLLQTTAAGGDSSDQLDCCDGLVCCENWNSQGSVCAQCCNDWDCGKDGTCNEGVCEYPILCIDDKGCPEHTCCCGDGSCSWHCCDHHHHHPHPKPPKPTPAAPVTTLPATGSGQESDSTGLFGAAALGAAAALYAAKKLRETPGAPETTE